MLVEMWQTVEEKRCQSLTIGGEELSVQLSVRWPVGSVHKKIIFWSQEIFLRARVDNSLIDRLRINIASPSASTSTEQHSPWRLTEESSFSTRPFVRQSTWIHRSFLLNFSSLALRSFPLHLQVESTYFLICPMIIVHLNVSVFLALWSWRNEQGCTIIIFVIVILLYCI